MDETEAVQRQSQRFLALYAMAWAGGSIAYVPFLTLILPARVAAVAGAQAIEWLAYIAFVGALFASSGNILFGWLSDLTRNRRGWICAGLILSSLALLAMPHARSLGTLLVMVALWQLALNMMLGPLSAWAGDCVPDRQKGMLGGLLSLAPALGALSGTFITLPGFAGAEQRIGLVATIVIIAVAPVLLFGRPRRLPALASSPPAEKPQQFLGDITRSRVVRLWLARFLVQISEAALFAFVLLWFRSIDPEFTDNRTANIFSFVLLCSVPIALFAGRWADRRDRPAQPLAMAAAATSFGLVCMGISSSLVVAIGGYVMFGVAVSVFLALHTAQTLRYLPRSDRRGRDLGIFNLTNTLPSLVMPWLTLAMVPMFGFSGLFFLLAALAAGACLLLAAFPSGK